MKVYGTYENYLKYQKIAAHLRGLLNKIWETHRHFSDYNYSNSPDYQELLAMGDKIVPFIISRMIDGQAEWLHICLLREITGQNPIKEEHAGLFYHQINDWLTWYLDSPYYEKDDIYHGLLD
jgi:hypothetical protein